MNPTPLRLAALATLAALHALAAPALAASTASVSISDSVSAAVGSVSDSLRRSSDSSTGKDRVAQGDYRIVEVAAAPERPGLARLTLQPETAAEDMLFLYVPQATVAQAALAAGQRVTATHRDYGVEFSRVSGAGGQAGPAGAAAAPLPFFLVLDDTWYRELPSRPVTL